MLPEFTEQGWLPPGIHRIAIEEFEQRFVYFAKSDRRFRIFDTLFELYREAKGSGIVKRFLVVGSFITSKPEPNDLDCLLVLDPSIDWHNLLPMEYNLVSRKRAHRIYGADVISVVDGSIDYREFLEFFQTTRGQTRVGIVEIAL